MTVYESVGNVVCATLRVEDVHSAKVFVLRTYAYDILCSLQGRGKLGIYASDESIGIARLHHHHAEVVAVKHLVVGLLEVVALTLSLVGKHLCVALAGLVQVVMTQVYYLYSFE